MNYPVMALARKSSSHAALLRLARRDCFVFILPSRLRAMCLIVVKLAGALPVRTRHSSSRNIMSMVQCRLFSTLQ